MKRAVFPGSFDPVTNGHMDVIKRAAALFDEVVVAVFDNPEKTSFFTLGERADFIRRATAGIPNVKVDCFDGLLIEYARNNGADVVVRGVRNVRDFDYEYELAGIYYLTGGIETVFIPARGENSRISSSMVRELIKHGKDPSDFVPFEWDS